MLRRVLLAIAGLALAAGTTWAASKSQSATVTLDRTVTINGKAVAAGEYKFTWTESGTGVDVTVKDGRKVLAESPATLDHRDKKFTTTGVVSRKDKNGNEAIAQLQLGGKKEALVFPIS